jgi:hypothetical protein
MAIWPKNPRNTTAMPSSPNYSVLTTLKRRHPNMNPAPRGGVPKKKRTKDLALAEESSAVALRAKTERLKALRLARDAAAPPPAPAAPKSRSKKKGSGGNLSDFLDGQAKEGRNG